MLHDGDLAEEAALLFCYNPASVFYSSMYTESLYALLSFAGLLLLAGHGRRPRLRPRGAAASFALAALTRSNGLLLCAFLALPALHRAAALRSRGLPAMVRALAAGTAQCSCVVAPFVAFQWYGFRQFCRPAASPPGGSTSPLGLEPGVPLPDGSLPRPWCQLPVPYLYGFVQSHYWNVGFLRFYQWRQAPNFVLAAPAVAIAAAATWHYTRARPRLVWSLGFSCPPCSAEETRQPAGGSGGPKPRAQLDAVREEPTAGPHSQAAAGQAIGRRNAKGWEAAAPGGPGVAMDELVLRESVAARGGDASGWDSGGSSPIPVESAASLRHRKGAAEGGQAGGGAGSRWQEASERHPVGGEGHAFAAGTNLGEERGFLSPRMLCFIYVLAMMLLVATTIMHVQVATRFLSSSPPVYWFSAYWIRQRSRATSGRRRWFQARTFPQRALWCFHLTYLICGTILFANFYPFV